MTLHQGDKLDDTSFIVLICDVEDIEGRLVENGMDKAEAKIKAKSLFDNDSFRSHFTDNLMDDFWLTIDNLSDEF